MIEKAHKTLRNSHEWSGTVRNGERSGTVNGQERYGQEHLGTIGAERSNALERIVENGHGMDMVRSRYGHAHVPKNKETLYLLSTLQGLSIGV